MRLYTKNINNKSINDADLIPLLEEYSNYLKEGIPNDDVFAVVSILDKDVLIVRNSSSSTGYFFQNKLYCMNLDFSFNKPNKAIKNKRLLKGSIMGVLKLPGKVDTKELITSTVVGYLKDKVDEDLIVNNFGEVYINDLKVLGLDSFYYKDGNQEFTYIGFFINCGNPNRLGKRYQKKYTVKSTYGSLLGTSNLNITELHKYIVDILQVTRS